MATKLTIKRKNKPDQNIITTLSAQDIKSDFRKILERHKKELINFKPKPLKIHSGKIFTAFLPFDTAKIRLNYLPVYQKYFQNLKINSLLELGVHEGESLKGWSAYFDKAHITGIDNMLTTRGKQFQKTNPKNITIIDGDCTTTTFNETFDIVIDDASHVGVQMEKSFMLLWPCTNYIYVIEDYNTQFTGQWTKGGSFTENYIKRILSAEDFKTITNDSVQGVLKFDIKDDTIDKIVFENNLLLFFKKQPKSYGR